MSTAPSDDSTIEWIEEEPDENCCDDCLLVLDYPYDLAECAPNLCSNCLEKWFLTHKLTEDN